MERTITVKGVGSVSLKPDQTVVTMTLRSLDKDYEKAVQRTAELYRQLAEQLHDIGFAEEDLKTESFQVNTEYENVRDRDGNYRSEFSGYACVHGLILRFDFDTVLLGKVLASITKCVAEPELAVQFTVKDKNAVSELLLQDASRNAAQKAEILTKASGVVRGRLLSVEYQWGELDIVSSTRYNMEAKCMPMFSAADLAFQPDDIRLTDSASFVWEIMD